jgi:hypothetical protein
MEREFTLASDENPKYSCGVKNYCAMSGLPMDPGDGIWDDGEWISWAYINAQVDDAKKSKVANQTHKKVNPNADSRITKIEAKAADSTAPVRPESCTPDSDKLDKLLEHLIIAAKQYLEGCDRHLPIYGELGELYAERRYGVKRHKPNCQGSDGRIGDTHVEIKTITPMKGNDVVTVKRAGNFGKLIVVKISADFKFAAKIVSRSKLPKGSGKYIRLPWSSISDET